MIETLLSFGILVAGAFGLLLWERVRPASARRLAPHVALITLGAAFAVSALRLGGSVDEIAAAEPALAALLSDEVARFERGMLLLALALYLVTHAPPVSPTPDANPAARRPAWYVLHLLSAVGGVLAVSANDLLLLSLGIELYAVGRLFLQRDAGPRAAAGVTRVVGMSALVFGLAALYASVGTTNLQMMGRFLWEHPGSQSALLYTGSASVMAGIGLSLGLLPPYGRQGGENDMLSPLVGTGALLRLSVNGLGTLYGGWLYALLGAGILAVVWGWFASRRSVDVGRARALEIAQRGFMLMALAYAPLDRGLSALAASTMAYLLGQMIVFACEAVARQTGQTPSYAGLFRRNPWLGAPCLVAFLSLAGAPSTLGYIGRSELLWAVQDQAQLWVSLIGLVLYVLCAADYLQLILLAVRPNPDAPRLKCHMTVCVSLILAALALVLLGIYPTPLLQWAQRMTVL